MARRIWVLAALLGTATAQEGTGAAAKPKGYLGVRIGALDAEGRAAWGIPEAVAEGVILIEAMPGSAAEKAGLRPGDVLVRIADTAVRTPEDLVGLVRSKAPGDVVTYVVRRGEGTIDGRLTLGTAPPPSAPPTPEKVEDRLNRVQREIEELNRRLKPRGPRTIEGWIRAVEMEAEAARAEGDRAALGRAEIRLELLRQMEAQGVRGQEERLDRIEKKLDAILERLRER